MRLNMIVLTSVVVGSGVVALGSGCAAEDPTQLTSDQQTTDEELRRHCEAEDEGWKERCSAWSAKHHDDGATPPSTSDGGSSHDAGTTKDASAAPPPPPVAPPPPPPPPVVTTCTSFTYSAWGACQATNTQTRTVVSSSPAGCSGGAPALSQSCVYVAPIDGAALYTQYCSGCHGNGKKGKSVAATQGAIANNTGGMGSLNGLTAAQLAAIAAAP